MALFIVDLGEHEKPPFAEIVGKGRRLDKQKIRLSEEVQSPFKESQLESEFVGALALGIQLHEDRADCTAHMAAVGARCFQNLSQRARDRVSFH